MVPHQTLAMITTVLILHLLLLSTTVTSSSPPILGLDTYLAQQFRRDPLSTSDTFKSLPSSIKHQLSLSPHTQTSTSSLLTSILSLQLSPSLHIKLVGPRFSSQSPSLLTSFLHKTQLSDYFHVISPLFNDKNHNFAVKHSPHVDVSLSSPSLSNSLYQGLKAEIEKTPKSLRSSLLSINYGVVDQIVKEDFEKEKPVHGVYLYLINLELSGKPYAYSYGHGDLSPGNSKCLGSVWTGKERYIWVDLGAGPVDYGPALAGDGMLPKGQFHPLATAHGGPKSERALLVDLASLAYSAYQVLLVPSLRIPVPFDDTLFVQFIHVYGSGGKADTIGLDWKMMEKTFMDEAKDGGLLLGDQSLSFKTYDVSFAECSICSFAISRSINSFTSRFLFDNYTLIVSEYLDSKRLHQILSDSAEEFRREAKIPEEDSGRVLPVYVFDLNYNTLLMLDQFHQSVAFKDMVIAVRTKNSQTVSDYSCNGHHVFTQTRDLERPLIGSILQSAWGVSPTHMLWSPRHNTTLMDYTWSVGQTPFGPFSEIASLSFVQKDAARRNLLLTLLNYTITSAVDALGSIASHGGDRTFFKQGRHVEFMQRWNLLKYKLDKAVSALSHLEFDMALFFTKSLEHDLFAIESLVYSTSQELEASLVCFKDPPFPWASFSMSAAVFATLCYVYRKRDKLFVNKRKQF